MALSLPCDPPSPGSAPQLSGRAASANVGQRSFTAAEGSTSCPRLGKRPSHHGHEENRALSWSSLSPLCHIHGTTGHGEAGAGGPARCGRFCAAVQREDKAQGFPAAG